MTHLALLPYGTHTPLDLPPLKPDAAAEIAPDAGVLDKDKVQGTIKRTWCGRMRCVYAKLRLSAVVQGAAAASTIKETLIEALEQNQSSYTCGSDPS